MKPNLLLIPTRMEADILQPLLSQKFRAEWQVELCGFGLVAAAARTSQLLGRHSVERVILAGIAGSYLNDCVPGTATEFAEVACDGIGVGAGSNHQSAGTMGWPHWDGTDGSCDTDTDTIGDRIPLSPRSGSGTGCLVSVAAASADERDADHRRQRWPDAIAEDMEGFGVAVACQLAGVPLQIVRGISNRSGDRNFSGWQVQTALKSTADILNRSL